MTFCDLPNFVHIFADLSKYTQQKEKVNTFSSSDFSYKTVIKSNKLYIKLKAIKFSFTLLGENKEKFVRMSKNIRYSLPRCKSKSCKNWQFAIDV